MTDHQQSNPNNSSSSSSPSLFSFKKLGESIERLHKSISFSNLPDAAASSPDANSNGSSLKHNGSYISLSNSIDESTKTNSLKQKQTLLQPPPTTTSSTTPTTLSASNSPSIQPKRTIIPASPPLDIRRAHNNTPTINLSLSVDSNGNSPHSSSSSSPPARSCSPANSVDINSLSKSMPDEFISSSSSSPPSSSSPLTPSSPSNDHHHHHHYHTRVLPQMTTPPTVTSSSLDTLTSPTISQQQQQQQQDSSSLFKGSNGFESEINSANGPLVGGIRSSRVGHIFDHFLVVGLPSTIDITCKEHDEKKKHTPQVIYQYPPEDPLPNDMISQFCFPSGLSSRSSQRSHSSSSLNQIAFFNLSHLLQPSHSHVFLLTTMNTLYYVYCFLSRFPFFQLHFQMLHAVLENERMSMLFSMTQATDPGCTTSSMDILDMYYKINMEDIKDRIQFKIPTHDYKTDYHCPIGSEDKLIGDWSLFTAFQLLSIDDILNIFTWLLTERSLFVCSKHLGNVSSIIFSFISLLKPFIWQCCFIPVLPDSLLESLDAPFPFIMGFNEVPEHVLQSKRDYLILDVDNKKLIYPESVSTPPVLPGNKKLRETLTSQRKEIFELQNKIPLDHLKNRYVQDTLSTFREYHVWMIDQISTGVITCINNMYIAPAAGSVSIDPPSSVELLNRQSIHFLEDQNNIKDIIQCLPEKYRNFFSSFFHTQLFAVNAVNLMRSIKNTHQNSINLIEKLESLIQLEEKSKEVLMEYQRMAKKENSKVNVDINIIKQQLKDSEGVINELRESKKKLEMEALATSPSKNSITSFLGFSSVSEMRKKKLEFGHRRSRSVTDQVEKNILKKSMKPPSLSFFQQEISKASISASSLLTKSYSSLSSQNSNNSTPRANDSNLNHTTIGITTNGCEVVSVSPPSSSHSDSDGSGGNSPIDGSNNHNNNSPR
eukprot:gene848-1057_t